ncbi:hypothetical protein, partial [Pandoraea sp.]|uniref:hypothetical protein n=1 Tax=Pandoraea sp. TaxID=1883445 RepID=UPI0035B28891
PNCSSSSAGIVGSSAGGVLGLRGIVTPWRHVMPQTRNFRQAPARVRFVRSRSAPSIDVVQEALMQAVGVPMIHWDVRRPPGSLEVRKIIEEISNL